MHEQALTFAFLLRRVERFSAVFDKRRSGALD